MKLSPLSFREVLNLTDQVLLVRFGQWLLHHRISVVVFWTLLLVLGVMFGPKVESILLGGSKLPGTETEAVVDGLKMDFGNRYSNELVVAFNSKTRTADDPEFQESVENIQLGLRESSKVNSIMTYYDTTSQDMIGKNGHSILGVIELDVVDNYAAQRVIPEIRQIVKNSAVPKWLNVYVVGEGAVFYDLAHSSGEDLVRAETNAFPIIILILVFTFGALLSSGIPIILGVISVTIALGIVYFVGLSFPTHVLAKNTVSMIGLGVGIDYSLFMVSRFREELKQGLTVPEAAVAIMNTSGRTILFSGTTVIIGFSSLYIANLTFLSSLANAAIAVVFIAVMAALTLLPVLLSWIGHLINWPKFLSNVIGRAKSGRMWHRVAMKVMRYPLIFFILTVAFLLFLAAPLMHIKTYTPTVTGLPKGAESDLGFQILKSDFVAGKIAPINIIIEAPPGKSIWSKDSITRLYKMTKQLEKDLRVFKLEGIVSIDSNLFLKDYINLYSNKADPLASDNIFMQMVGSYTDSSGKGRKTLVRVTTIDEPGSFASRAVVKKIRNQLVPQFFAPAGYKVIVGGGSSFEVDLDEILLGRLPLLIVCVCIVTFIILMILFRSILIPLKSILMNVLSVLASFGILVAVFQDNVLGNIAGIRVPGGTSSMILSMLFAALFGLSMDYEIFLTLRMKEEHDNGHSNEESVAWGLERTGGLVTSAALIMVAVFGSFVLTSMTMTQEFGLGLAVAIFLDATIIRVLLMPATMRLMGEWNWWFPKGLNKILPHIEIKE